MKSANPQRPDILFFLFEYYVRQANRPIADKKSHADSRPDGRHDGCLDGRGDGRPNGRLDGLGDGLGDGRGDSRRLISIIFSKLGEVLP